MKAICDSVLLLVQVSRQCPLGGQRGENNGCEEILVRGAFLCSSTSWWNPGNECEHVRESTSVCTCCAWCICVLCVRVRVCVRVLLACALCGMFENTCTYIRMWSVCVEDDGCSICVSVHVWYAWVWVCLWCICVCGYVFGCVCFMCLCMFVRYMYCVCVCLGYVVYVSLHVVYVREFCVWFGGIYVCWGLLINMFMLHKKCLQFLSPPIQAPRCSRVIFLKHKAKLSLSLLKEKKKMEEQIWQRLPKA